MRRCRPNKHAEHVCSRIGKKRKITQHKRWKSGAWAGAPAPLRRHDCCREGKGREGKGREGKGREGKGREGKGKGREAAAVWKAAAL